MRLYKFKENFELNKSSQNNTTSVRISESIFNQQEEKLIVKIEAIHAITTGNYNTYLSKELRGDFEKHTGVYSWTYPYCKPVLTHHNSSDGEPIGRVIEAEYKETSLAGPPVILLTVEISDKDAIEKIQDGRYQTVSIGGYAEHAFCSICGHDWIEDGWGEHWPGHKYDGEIARLEMTGLTFIEVSFVNVPADSYARIVDIEESESGDIETNESYSIKNGKIIKENIQGGNEMELQELQNKYNTLKESYDTKIEKLELFETKIGNIEKERDLTISERDKSKEDKETLELKLENLQSELNDLTQENANLKTKQHKILAEKVVAKKIELKKLDEENLEEAVEAHIKRTEESLNDTLADLIAEAEHFGEVTEPGEPLKNEGLHNAGEEANVEEVGDDDDSFDVNKEMEDL